MRLLITLVALSLLTQAMPSLAAQPQTPIPLTEPTMFKPLPQSMQQLITNGYLVVNIAIGLSGFGYLLKQDTHYVTCAVQPDRAKPELFVSECRAMN